MTELTVVSSQDGVATPDRFLVLWQDPDSRRYHRVGFLERDAVGYSFRYEPTARALTGFAGFAEFPAWNEVYRSEPLFATFANRVMTARRESYERYVESLGVVGPHPEPFEVLARTLGTRATDHVQLLPVPRRNAAGSLSLHFLVHGTRHVDPDASRLSRVQAGDTLYLAREPGNPQSPVAVLVGASPEPTRNAALGYVPDVLSGLVRRLMESYPVVVTAAHVNQPNGGSAPDHMRLLARLDAIVPDDFEADSILDV